MSYYQEQIEELQNKIDILKESDKIHSFFSKYTKEYYDNNASELMSDLRWYNNQLPKHRFTAFCDGLKTEKRINKFKQLLLNLWQISHKKYGEVFLIVNKPDYL